MEYWELLLNKQKERGKRGFTIPFLIGVQKILESSDTFIGIEELITEIILSASNEITIGYCDNLKTILLEIHNPLNTKVYYPLLNNSTQEKLSVADFLKSEFGNNIEDIILTLKERFQDKIDEEKFSASFVQGREALFDKFSVADLDLIFAKKCLNEVGL